MGELAKAEIRGLVHELCDGSMGAINVCMMLAVVEKRVDLVRRFKELGIRGPAIWVAWKDYAKQEVDQLAKGLFEDLPELNKVFAVHGIPPAKVPA